MKFRVATWNPDISLNIVDIDDRGMLYAESLMERKCNIVISSAQDFWRRPLVHENPGQAVVPELRNTSAVDPGISA